MNIDQNFPVFNSSFSPAEPLQGLEGVSKANNSSGEIQDGIVSKSSAEASDSSAGMSSYEKSLSSFIEKINKQFTDLIAKLTSKLNASTNAEPTQESAKTKDAGAISIPQLSQKNVSVSEPKPTDAANDAIGPVNQATVTTPAAPVEKAPVSTPPAVQATESAKSTSGSGEFSTAPQTVAKSPQETADFAKRLVGHLQKELNITEDQAKGIVANLMHESAGLNPGMNQGMHIGEPSGNMSDDNANGYGLAQWGGVRKMALVAQAKEAGIPASSEKANVDFLVSELKGQYSGSIAALKSTNTAAEATQSFCSNYEKPSEPNIQGRLDMLKEIA